MRYSLTADTGMSLRTDHTTAALKTAILDQGKIAKGDEVWVALLTTSLAKAGDKWLHVKELDGKPVDGWIAVIHLGKIYSTVTDSGVVIPPPPATDSVKRIVKAVITYETTSGAIVTKEVFPVT